MTGNRSKLRIFALGSFQLILVLAVAFGAISLSAYMKSNQPARVQIETQTFVPNVQTRRVRLQSRPITLSATGTIEPSVYVNLTPQVSGVVAFVRSGLGSGARFEAGQILFEIDPRDLAIDLRRSEADLGAARAALDIEQAESRNAIREWESFGRGQISDLAARGPQVRSAEAKVLISEAAQEAARLNLERAGVSLPFEGRIVDLAVAPGQRVSANQNYGKAYAFEAIEVRVAFPPEDLAVLQTVEGTPATITANVLGREIEVPSHVSRLDAEISRTTRLASLIMHLDPEDVKANRLFPGTFAAVTLHGPQIGDVAEIPNAALQARDQVWTVVEDRLRMTDTVRVVQRGRETSLVTGLAGGARIAVGTIAGAVDGMTVRSEP